MKKPLSTRRAFCFGLLFALVAPQPDLAQTEKKVPLGGALTSGRIQNSTYINESLGLQFAPPSALRFGAPQLKGNPGTVPLLVTIAAWGDGGAVFYADDLGYYPQIRRSTQAYVERVFRNQKQDGSELAGEQLEEKLGGVTFARVDFHQPQSYEAVFVKACAVYAFVFIFAGSDLERTNRLIAQTTVKLDSKNSGCGGGSTSSSPQNK